MLTQEDLSWESRHTRQDPDFMMKHAWVVGRPYCDGATQVVYFSSGKFFPERRCLGNIAEQGLYRSGIYGGSWRCCVITRRILDLLRINVQKTVSVLLFRGETLHPKPSTLNPVLGDVGGTLATTLTNPVLRS